MRHDESGNVLDVGRKTRTVPAAIRRALDTRDPTCVWGCHSKDVQAHHIEYWAEGGETKLENLCNLCITTITWSRIRMGGVIPEVPTPSEIPDEPLADVEGDRSEGKAQWGGSDQLGDN